MLLDLRNDFHSPTAIEAYGNRDARVCRVASDEDDQIVVGRIRGGGVIESNINYIRFANRNAVEDEKTFIVIDKDDADGVTAASRIDENCGRRFAGLGVESVAVRLLNDL